jgi:hypothetical protein
MNNFWCTFEGEDLWGRELPRTVYGACHFDGVLTTGTVQDFELLGMAPKTMELLNE